MVGTGGDALEQTRGRGRVGGDALWLRRVGVDALQGGDALEETRCGSDVLA